MNDDQFWRIVIGTVVFVAIGVFRPQISSLLKRIGYTGWR